jgi:hypothetical protein
LARQLPAAGTSCCRQLAAGVGSWRGAPHVALSLGPQHRQHLGAPGRRAGAPLGGVWSTLLCKWSALFDAMIKSRMMEGNRRVEITDFSGEIVEASLRFMYSGKLDVDIRLLVMRSPWCVPKKLEKWVRAGKITANKIVKDITPSQKSQQGRAGADRERCNSWLCLQAVLRSCPRRTNGEEKTPRGRKDCRRRGGRA